MIKTKTLYLKFIEEFSSFGISKKEVQKLATKNIVADIRLPEDVLLPAKNASTLGFLLGQDTSRDGTEYYSISLNYTKALLNTKANICFLDYEMPQQQLTKCHGIVLPGGNFDFPESFFIGGKNLGTGIGKRFLAYETIIEAAYNQKKPMLGICAGAQMIGAILGKMKMYLHLSEEVAHPCKHKPTEAREVCMHDLILIQGTPIFKIMDIPQTTTKIAINSRHVQAMVHSALQDNTQPPLVPMTIYAVSQADGIPEIWGNEQTGILCVQGHPEDLAAAGDKQMQNLYNYIAIHAAQYKENKQ